MIQFNEDGEILECDKTFTASGMSETIKVSKYKTGISVQISPTGGTANIWSSNDGDNWTKLSLGDVSVVTIASLIKPVQFLRVENVTSTSTRFYAFGS
jgi:hypothetical protein